jgi:IclR helix-turn-helix domain
MSKRSSSSAPSRAQDPAGESVHIELSSAQVDTIVREATGAGNMSVLLAGLESTRETIEDNRQLIEDPRMSRSLLQGLLVLAAFPGDGCNISVTAVGHKLGLGDSTTHRYISTLLSVGLIERDPSTRLYRLAL